MPSGIIVQGLRHALMISLEVDHWVLSYGAGVVVQDSMSMAFLSF